MGSAFLVLVKSLGAGVQDGTGVVRETVGKAGSVVSGPVII